MRNQRRWSNKGARTKCQVDGESFFEKAGVQKRIRKKYAASTSTAATKKTATSTSTAAGTKKKKAAKISIGNIKACIFDNVLGVSPVVV
ncbi:hypothetical protein C5167_030088 [Papaver somniferum]|nr:hypothetical protein C5167_030088 [Papaver somniferum]